MRIRDLQFLSVICMTGGIFFKGSFPLQADSSPVDRTGNHVLIIGIDGTRPDVVARANTPNLDGLIRHGRYIDHVQILGRRFQENDTSSGPGWSSILTGVWADKHGVLDNKFRGTRLEAFPHFFKRLKNVRPEAQTVSLVSWEPIHSFILSSADIQKVESLPPLQRQTTDLKASAGPLKIDTRDGNWHHLLAKREDGIVQIYLDGQLAGEMEDTAGSFQLDGEFYYIGRDTRSGEICFHGQMDNSRLWNRPLSETEIQQLARSARSDSLPVKRDGLVAEYRYEELEAPAEDRKTIKIPDSAGHPMGPFPAQAVSRLQPMNFVVDPPDSAGQSAFRSLDLPAEGDEDHGVLVPLSGPLKSITLGDFTIESWFRTTARKRNILMGNHARNAGALNLELLRWNGVRVWIQPPHTSHQSVLDQENQRDQIMAENAARILLQENPTAMFVYFHQTDATGHRIGFSPDVPEYVQAIENVDRYVGTVLQAMRSRATYADENWLVIVCTDHGGIERKHGGGKGIPEICNVFLIVSGPSVTQGSSEERAYLVDVAATALTHLIGPVPDHWELDGQARGLKNSSATVP